MKKIPTILLLLVPYVFIAAFLNFGLTKYVFLLWPILWVVICRPIWCMRFFFPGWEPLQGNCCSGIWC